MVKRKPSSVPVRAVRSTPVRSPRFELIPRTNRLWPLLGWEDAWLGEFSPLSTLFRAASPLLPQVDIFETDKEVVVKSPLPGIDPKHIRVDCDKAMLSLSGEFKKDETVKQKDYYRREIASGEFSRRIPLPVEVKADGAKANYANGILEIHLPKATNGKRQEVHVPVEAKK